MPTHAELGSATVWSWHHSGLVVKSLDESIEFYRDAFGYEVAFVVTDLGEQFQRTVGVEGVVCDLAQLVTAMSSTRLELIAVRNVPTGLPAGLPVHVGVGHDAYQVRDLDESIAALVDRGGSPVGEIVDFSEGRAVYCWTPAGTVVELEEAW